jgi:hypothetical protein
MILQILLWDITIKFWEEISYIIFSQRNKIQQQKLVGYAKLKVF